MLGTRQCSFLLRRNKTPPQSFSHEIASSRTQKSLCFVLRAFHCSVSLSDFLHHLPAFSRYTACTFLGPSRKRGPPKGYIDAIEARLHQTEALLGIMIATTDERAKSLLRDLSMVSLPDLEMFSLAVHPMCPTLIPTIMASRS
jgi:hypothetical protein